MPTWAPNSRTATLGGRHRTVVTAPHGSPVDISYFRGVPIKLESYSSADPFGDSVASIACPQISQMDDPNSPELRWAQEDTSVDIWWVPAMTVPADWAVATETEDTILYENPLTGKADLLCPAWVYTKVGAYYVRTKTKRGFKVYEGFIADINPSQDGLTISCQGACYEIDALLAKPRFPSRPQTLESLIAEQFSHTVRPHLRTQNMVIEWPAGWTLRAPAFTGSSNTFDPNVKPGTLWTGYTQRQTGSWDHSLTSFVQNLLATMLVKPGSGTDSASNQGNQWTLRLAREGDPAHPAGRTPVLKVRDRLATPRFSLWTGIQGVRVDLTRDGTQKENSIYGTGTDIAGTVWRNSVLSTDGSRTDYRPLAALRSVWPVDPGSPGLDLGIMVRESYIQFPSGLSQTDGSESAAQMLSRGLDPGFAGSITLSVDPSPTLSRWQIAAGDTMLLQGYWGSGADGLRLHIASVEAAPDAGTVTLTVDSRYRDLLTLGEALARMRDALTPAKLLQLNRNSVTIEDIQAPWDYSAGSGYVPKPALSLFAHKPTSTRFPYSSWLTTNPPRYHPSWYVRCQANAPNTKSRWAGPIQILMSEKGSIRRSEFVCCDAYGNIVPIPFHVSLYYNNGINASFMPNNGTTYSPFLPGAFQSIDPTTGQPWSTPGHNPDDSMAIGWGNADEPAGYSPGTKKDGDKPTGLLIDESTWTFDCSAQNPNYDHLAKAGKEPKSVISLYAMFYAAYTSPVYFTGRLFREEPGNS